MMPDLTALRPHAERYRRARNMVLFACRDFDAAPRIDKRQMLDIVIQAVHIENDAARALADAVLTEMTEMEES